MESLRAAGGRGESYTERYPPLGGVAKENSPPSERSEVRSQKARRRMIRSKRQSRRSEIALLLFLLLF
jgi:hypothetical protein